MCDASLFALVRPAVLALVALLVVGVPAWAGPNAGGLDGGTCAFLSAEACAAEGGSWYGPEITCSPNPCPQLVGACCLSSGFCFVLTQASCAGDWLGAGTACVPNPCPTPPPPPPPIGGPNANGVLIAHDTGLAYTSGQTS